MSYIGLVETTCTATATATRQEQPRPKPAAGRLRCCSTRDADDRVWRIVSGQEKA